MSQPASFAHLLILPFSAFSHYAHTRLFKGHFLVLRRQSGTLSLTKSGHPTPFHASNHHLKLIFFSSPTHRVWRGGKKEREWGRERGKENERERERERERTSGLSQSVRGGYGPCTPEEKWHRKELLLLIIIIIIKNQTVQSIKLSPYSPLQAKSWLASCWLGSSRR